MPRLLDAQIVAQGEPVRIGDVVLSVYVVLRAKSLRLSSWRKPANYTVSKLQLVDPRIGRELGEVWIHPPLPRDLQTAETFRAVYGVFESASAMRYGMYASLLLARRMYELGYVAIRSRYGSPFTSMFPGVDLIPGSEYKAYFGGIYDYRYRGAVIIRVDELNYRCAKPDELVLNYSTLYVRSPYDGGEVAHIIKEALRPWGPAAYIAAMKVTDSKVNAPLKGFKVELSAATQDFTLADYLGEFIPRLARRIKGRVDSKRERSRAELLQA